MRDRVLVAAIGLLAMALLVAIYAGPAARRAAPVPHAAPQE